MFDIFEIIEPIIKEKNVLRTFQISKKLLISKSLIPPLNSITLRISLRD